MDYRLIATCAFGIEKILSNELKELGYEDLKVENGKVEFDGDEMDIAICNIHLRTAERVLIKLGEFKALSFEELFQGTKAINFGELIPISGKMHVVGKSVKSQLHSVPDCQSIVKKAVVESMKKTYDREIFAETGAVYKIEIALLKDIATITVDTSGAGLHRRGYREHSGAAPLKETLAAALVLISGYDGSRPLIDPFCGSGTILIEAAMIARNIAPNADREFVSESWPSFPKDIYPQVRDGARNQVKSLNTSITGYDNDTYVLSTAKMNAKKAGVFNNIFFKHSDFMDLKYTEKNVTIITNPPYGERLGELETIRMLMEKMGRDKAVHEDFDMYVLSAVEGFEKAFGRKSHKNRKLYNGRILTYLYQYFAEKKKED
ncbi:class I SAM-dependent RNA methyltransferase [Proteiniclasticum sp.]|uniref:THUMP domain-containing class I SAM-dependent RNA methyltransferase n=1 Tax=Proteiniclasticum sp. TaxID=2053595 RepID=UPI002897BAF6|nr:class I SAM-dependent RNA methyltransferase [Proteiniclasticum sp.]